MKKLERSRRSIISTLILWRNIDPVIRVFLLTGALGRMGELACRTHIGGRGASRRGGERITDEPVQEGAAAPPDKTRKLGIDPSLYGSGSEKAESKEKGTEVGWLLRPERRRTKQG
jgi:hypothetical protein